MNLLYYIISGEGLQTSTVDYSEFSVLSSFVVVDIMYSSCMRRFWFGFVRKDWNYSRESIFSADQCRKTT